MRHGRSRTSRAGFTLIELLIVVAIIGVIAALAAPFLLQARASSNEASAIGSLRAINSAETNYSVTCASSAYAVAIPVLVAQNYLSPDMGFNPKSGYNFGLQPGLGSIAGPNDCVGTPTQTVYYATGMPVVVGTTGRRGFATNPSGSLWQDTTGNAPVEPFVEAGTVAPIR